MKRQSHLTTEQIDLLQEVKWWIRRDAHGFDMDLYLARTEWGVPGLRAPERNTCGTTMCIAGYIVAIHDGKEPIYADQIIDRVYELIPYGDSLFVASGWPTNIRRAYDLAKTDLEKADAACRAIDAFIAGEF